MSEEIEEVSAYVLNCWDCPACGLRIETDTDLPEYDECECGEKVHVR